MDEFKFDELKNFEVPESWIENALKLTSQKKAPKPVRLYRCAAVAAACIALVTAIGFTLILGFNRNVVPTDPGGGDTPVIQITEESTADTTDSRERSTIASTETIMNHTQGGTVVTEPSEGSTGAGKKSNQKQQGTTQSGENKNTQAQSNGEKQAETSNNDVTENEEPTEKPQTKDNIVPTTGDSWSSHQGEFGAAGEYKPRPTETEAYGCHFVTSVKRSTAQGNTYYCRIEDGSENILGSGAAQKYDWGKPGWPIDLQYTADFVMYYGETYTVTFYSSDGVTVWSGAVYLKEHQTNYLLY